MQRVIKNISEIFGQKVRLVDRGTSNIVDKSEAISKSINEGLDLILMQDGEIPVVKLCDMSKIQYEKEKNIKHNKQKKCKHIRIGPHTQEHDLIRFAQHATKFIKEGHSVILCLEVKGRDRMFKDIISKKMKDFIGLISVAKPGKVSVSDDGSRYTQSLN